MGGCLSSNGPYPAQVPDEASTKFNMPDVCEILRPNETNFVEYAIKCCAKSFVGTDSCPPPGEFDWLLHDKAGNKITDAAERQKILQAMMGFCVHYAFLLGRRGLVMQVRSGMYEGGPSAELKEPDGTAKICGVMILYFYPKKWTPSVDGSCLALKAAMNSGASKWDARQKEVMEGSRSKALDKAILDMRKQHCTGSNAAYIYLQVIATDPECQGIGVGKKLMQAACAIADGMSLPLYLECDAGKNDAMYKKYRFAEIGSAPLAVKEGAFAGRFIAMRRAPGVPGLAGSAWTSE